MRKTITLILFSLAFTSINGQSQKGTMKVTVAGAPLIGNSQEFSNGLDGLFFKPSFGYFISDRTSIELNFIYAFNNGIEIDNIDGNYDSYAFVPSLRTSLFRKNKSNFFGEIGYGFGTIEYKANDENFTTPTFEDLSGGLSIFSFGFGANYFFDEKIGLEVLVPYIITSNITSRNSELLYSGFGPSIGLTFRL